MRGELQQEQLEVYATNATAIDKPQGTNYTQGVKVGRTIPAKWWNWLFNMLTRCLNYVYTDSLQVFTEVKNTITQAGLTPSASDNTQMAQAAQIISERAVTNYVDNRKRQLFYNWSSSDCTGLPSSAYKDIEWLRPVRNSGGKAFYAMLYNMYTSDMIPHHRTIISDNLLDWYTLRTVDESMVNSPVDAVYYKGKYYYLTHSGNSHKTLLFATDSVSKSLTYLKTFNEYGNAIGLRVVNGILWFISASATVYDDVSYHSYYTTDGINWEDAGAIFKNTSQVTDDVSEVVEWRGTFVLGNMITSDGLTWTTIIPEWENIVHSVTFISSSNALIFQFSEDQGYWYQKGSPTGQGAQRRDGHYALLKQCADTKEILGRNTETGKAAFTIQGTSFNETNVDYPTDPRADFFKIDNYYFIGNYYRNGLGLSWVGITLPEGAEIVQYSGVGCCIVAGNYFSGDRGATWTEGNCNGSPYCAKPDSVSANLTCLALASINNKIMRRVTFNGINRVIGTTLYLK